MLSHGSWKQECPRRSLHKNDRDLAEVLLGSDLNEAVIRIVDRRLYPLVARVDDLRDVRSPHP